jgi:hypothetical protein
MASLKSLYTPDASVGKGLDTNLKYKYDNICEEFTDII